MVYKVLKVITIHKIIEIFIMKDLEANKFAAAVILAGLIALVTGKIADGIYHPEHEPEERGYAIDVPEETESGVASAPKEEEVIDIAALMASADAAAGAKTYKKCAACHATEAGVNKVGPSLAGIVDHDIAAVDGYSYSDALSSKEGKWNNENLFAFLKKPKDFAPGTKMTFAGLRKPKDIANIIKFLESK